MDVKIRNFGTLLAKMAEIEGAIGRQFQSLSILRGLTFWTRVLAPDIYGAHRLRNDVCYLLRFRLVFVTYGLIRKKYVKDRSNQSFQVNITPYSTACLNTIVYI